jgi:hypothetical protein
MDREYVGVVRLRGPTVVRDGIEAVLAGSYPRVGSADSDPVSGMRTKRRGIRADRTATADTTEMAIARMAQGSGWRWSTGQCGDLAI